MNRKMTALALVLFGPTFAPMAAAGTVSPPAAISDAEAHSIGVEAYLYFYPLVTMELTREQLTNVEPGKEPGRGPMNAFANVAEFPSADFKAVVRPNFDTLYSIAWLDLTKEPMIVSVPETGGRYYLMPMLDMWTDVFAAPGWRTTGTQAADFLVTPPGWRPDRREKFVEEFKLPKETQRIEAPTPYVWIVGRTKTDGPPDYDAIHKIQAGFKITPLSRWGKTPEPVSVKIDKAVDMKTPPKLQVDTMPAGRFFAIAAELLKRHPPHITDEPIIARMKRIGFDAGKSFDINRLDPSIRSALATVPEDAQKLMQLESPDHRTGRERLVDEHRYDGGLWQLLSQTRHSHAARPRCQLARGRDLPAESRRRHRQAARRREQLCAPLRQSEDSARRSILVGHAL